MTLCGAIITRGILGMVNYGEKGKRTKQNKGREKRE